MIKRFFSSQLISGSLVMTLGTAVAGVFNYLYHLFMGRMLGPVDYGILASLISLAYLLSVPTATLNLVIVKFVSALKGKDDFGAIARLFKVSSKKILPFTLLTFLIFLASSYWVVPFLHLPSFFPFMLILVSFFISIFLTINRAFLQGLTRFAHFSLSAILEVLLKLLIAIGLVFWGFKVNGALFGFLVGGIVAYFYTLVPLRLVLTGQQEEKITPFKNKEFFSFALPVFLSTLAFTSLYTTDVVLVRHFLSGHDSGFYAALSVLGKIIFFVTSPMVAVAFPLISERHAKGVHYRHLLWVSFFLISLVSLLATLLYFLLPQFIIKLLYGIPYLEAAPYLGVFAIFLTFYSLCFLLVNFFLSIGKTKVVVFPLITGFLQILLIWFFHQNLWQIILISVFLFALLFVILLLYCLLTIKRG